MRILTGVFLVLAVLVAASVRAAESLDTIIIDAGADPTAIKVYANGLTVATELEREGTAGPFYPQGMIGLPFGATIVPAPKMGADEVLVVDTLNTFGQGRSPIGCSH